MPHNSRSRTHYGVGMDEPVPVTTVASEHEADVVCGLLRSAGLACGFRPTAAPDSTFGGLLAGRMEILVHPPDLKAARAVIAAADSP
jgi:hypothetical protein